MTEPSHSSKLDVIRPFLVPVVIGLVLIAALVGGALWVIQYRAQQEANLKAEFEEKARTIASVVASTFHPYRRSLSELASSPEILEAFKDARNMEAATVRIGKTLPPHLLLRLLPPDTDIDFDTKIPPLGFGSIDLMRKAQRDGSQIPVEHYMRDGDVNYAVVIERAVDASSELVGFLHLSVDASQLRNKLREATPAETFVEIVQRLDTGAPVRIASVGRVPTGELDSATVKVPGTIWEIRVRAEGKEASTGFSLRDVLPMLAALVAVLGLVFVFLKRRGATGGKTAAPLVVEYRGAIDAIFSGNYPGMDALVLEATVDASSFQLPETDDPNANTLTSKPDDLEAALQQADGDGEEDVPDYVVHPSVFRTYDIRGIVDVTLDEEAVYLIGRALGAEAVALEQNSVVIARDGRNSSNQFAEALIRGLTESGLDIVDIGLTPTPILYFATHYLDARSGVMITGSHNPGNYNGLKMVLDGKTLSGDAIQALRQRIEAEDFVEGEVGKVETVEIIPDYIRRISEEIPISLGDSLHIVVDCGNGVPGIVAPHLFRALGHDVEELHCEVDGDFPNHHPDPSQPENLEDLIAIVRAQGADLGLAFDGDGDRLGVIDSEGNIIWPDRQMILFARDVLSRQPGAPIIFDVKCTGRLANAIREAGGEPVMYKTGHSLIKSKMQEISSPLAGEMSGHIFFKERWYGFDDALYSACRLLEILVNAGKPAVEVFAELPMGVATPELRLDMPESRHAEFMQAVIDAAAFPDGELNDIDGLRVDFPDSWGLIRASNTTPCLVLRFEGDTLEALDAVKDRFREMLLSIDDTLELPF